MNKYLTSALFGAILVGAASATTIAAPVTPVAGITAPSAVESVRYDRRWRHRNYSYRHHRGHRYGYRHRSPGFGIYLGSRHRYGDYGRSRYY